VPCSGFFQDTTLALFDCAETLLLGAAAQAGEISKHVFSGFGSEEHCPRFTQGCAAGFGQNNTFANTIKELDLVARLEDRNGRLRSQLCHVAARGTCSRSATATSVRSCSSAIMLV